MINLWIKEQISAFPSNTSKFDYRKLLVDGKFNDQVFSRYTHNDLEEFFLSATTVSEKAKGHSTVGALHDFRHKLSVRMVIAILCVAMNPSCVFVQTLVGLVCYAYGLSDLGFSVLNMIGCCCSIDQIRKHGSYWAKNRVTSKELAVTNASFWRVSFDNLNFKIKYAKKLITCGPKNAQLDYIPSLLSLCSYKSKCIFFSLCMY